MKTSLKIECIGDNYDQIIKFWKNVTADVCGNNLAASTFSTFKASYFVAEITGFHAKFKYERKFIQCKKDYRNSNSKGSRGVYAFYILESGKIYDVLEPYSWKNSHRYFCTVDNKGDIEILTKEEVDQCLKNRLA
jgi:hypothetical protein